MSTGVPGPGKDSGRKPVAVLDTSALLAMMQSAPGGSMVGIYLGQSVVSAVNWSEVVEHSRAQKIDVEGLRQDFEMIGLQILPFTAEDADKAASLWDPSQRIRLSLGDRACLALASRLGIAAATADRTWQQLDVGVKIRILR